MYKIEHPIVTHYAGSIAYGTNLPTSDVDIRGLFCATQEQVRSPFFNVNEVNMENEEDGKLYELSKFIKLYLDGNPNILETLWVDESDIITSSEVYEYLRGFREELLSSKLAFTFSGYAISQLKRIKGHHKWINNPQPEQPPLHGDYLKMVQNFTDIKVMPREFNLDHLEGFGIVHYGGNIFGSVEEGGSTPICSGCDFNVSCKQDTDLGEESRAKPRFIFKYLQDQYKLDKEKHKNYWTWKKNRNKVRSEMEEESGFDRKHAMHLVRLLKMSEEALTGKGIIVKRPDALELLDIRNGGMSYEKLLSYAEEKDSYIRGELYKNTSLPKKPNVKLAARVLMDCQDMCWINKEESYLA